MSYFLFVVLNFGSRSMLQVPEWLFRTHIFSANSNIKYDYQKLVFHNIK